LTFSPVAKLLLGPVTLQLRYDAIAQFISICIWS
jgi:hypothetical protein